MSSSREAWAGFRGTCSDNGLNLRSAQRQDINAALSDPHYGFVMQDNLTAVTEMLNDPHPDGAITIEYVPTAMHGLAVLLSQSGKAYRSKHATPDKEQWDEHVRNAREGSIVLLPNREHWTSADFGERQTNRADQMLDSAPSEVQQLLAMINYRAFRSQTMAGPTRTLATDPETAAMTHELEAMPHLTVTNWALAQTVQQAYRYMSSRKEGSMYVIDLCSGSGSTLAPIVRRLGAARKEGYGLQKGGIGMMGVETTPYLYDDLAGEFMNQSKWELTGLGIDTVERVKTNVGRLALQTDEISLVLDDVVRAMKRLELPEITDNDLVVVTSNYGLHRIPSGYKHQIFRRLALVKNLAVAMGDLSRNGSKVNRGYYNLTNNGPLNAGNALLGITLSKEGIESRIVGFSGFQPDYIDRVLRDRLYREIDNDGFLMIGARGELARQALIGKEAE